MKKRLFTLSWILMIGMIVGMTSCQDEMLSKENFRPEVTLDMERGDLAVFNTAGPIVEPVFMDDGPGGNVKECEEIGDYLFSTGKLDGADRFSGTAGPITWWTVDETYVHWTSTVPVIAAFILKGGPGANVYYYHECTSGDGNLVSPLNTGGNIPELSNFQICWTPCETPPPPDCGEETAFGGNTAGGGPAWWFYFDTTGPATQDIYAGQKKVDGTSVTYSNGKITIVLGDKMHLQDVKDPVKIQGYDAGKLPSRRPAAGRFSTYKGSDLVDISVGDYHFFVIHIDAEVCWD
jgi:hypothetical protein